MTKLEQKLLELGSRRQTTVLSNTKATRPPFDPSNGSLGKEDCVEVVTLASPLEESRLEQETHDKVPSTKKNLSGLEQLSQLRDSLVQRQKQRLIAVSSSLNSPVRPFVSVNSLSPEGSSWAESEKL